MRHEVPFITTKGGLPTRWYKAPPFIYQYGVDLAPCHRAAVELALWRWERHVGMELARPYRVGDDQVDILIAGDDLYKLEFDPSEFTVPAPGMGVGGGPMELRPMADFDTHDTGLEFVYGWVPVHTPDVFVAMTFLLERTGTRAELLEPALHGWGHCLRLAHSDRVIDVMHEHPAGHARPSPAEVRAIRREYGVERGERWTR